MYFDFRTYRKVIRLVATDRPSPKRLLVHGLLLALLSLWAACNAVCLALDRLFFPRYRRVRIAAPVFIVGNARSGTTLFHRLLCGDEERFVYFRTWEILFPSLLQKKAIRATVAGLRRAFPRAAQRLARWESRQLGEIKKQHPLGIDKPEEDEFLLLLSFASSVIVVLFPYLDQLGELVTFDERPAGVQRRILGFYRECVQRQLAFHGGDRTLVSKNPAFVTKMRALAREFPDAKFVYLVRSPFETLPSILKLLRTVWQQLGMDPQHIERSTRALASGCVHDYHYALDVLAELPESRYAIVPYAELIDDPKATVERVYDRLGLPVSPAFASRLEAERDRQKHYQSENAYTLAEFGLSEEELAADLADILDRFGFRPAQTPPDEFREMV